MVKLETKKFVKTWPTHSLCCCLCSHLRLHGSFTEGLKIWKKIKTEDEALKTFGFSISDRAIFTIVETLSNRANVGRGCDAYVTYF